MTSDQGKRPSSDERRGVNIDPILEELGGTGPYQMIQLSLQIISSFLFPFPLLTYIFTGYQPDYQCREVENVTELASHFPEDVTNFTLHDVKYHQCSIDVTLNSSASSSSAFSLPCVAGVNFSMPDYTSFLTEWSLVCDKAGLAELTQSGYFGGQIVGTFVFSVLDDRYGRKKVYMFCSIGMTIIMVAMSFVPNYYFFLVSKIASGALNIGMTRSGYTMFIELMPQKRRYIGSFLDSLLWTLGCLVLALLAYCLQGMSWRYLMMAQSSAFGVCLFLPCFLDESLRWLVATGKVEEAERILKKACRMNGKDFDKIKAMLHDQTRVNKTKHQDDSNSTGNCKEEENPTEAKKEEGKGMNGETRVSKRAETEETTDSSGTNMQMMAKIPHDGQSASGPKDAVAPQEEVFSAKYTVLDLFRHRVVLVPFLVSVGYWMTSNLYYYVVMLGSANLSGNRFLNFSLLNLQDIPANSLSCLLLHRFNRRPVGFWYQLLSGIFLIISVGLVASGGQGAVPILATVAQYMGMFALTGAYIAFFTFYIEIYPTAMRAVGTGATRFVVTLADMASPFLLMWGERTPWAPGVFMGSACILTSFTIWLLPETRHRKLPDTIEEIKAWKNTDPNVPETGKTQTQTLP